MPPSIYTGLTQRDAATRLPARRANAALIRALVDGDQFQAGDLWLGELPAEHAVREKLARGIVSENILHQGIWRHMAGILGREPRWGLVTRAAAGARVSPAEAALDDATEQQRDTRIAAIEAALVSWWDRRAVTETLRRALLIALQEGRAPLRLYVPAGLMQRRETPAGEAWEVPRIADLTEALAYLYLDAVEPAVAGVHIDPDTKQPLGLFTFTEAQQQVVEISYVDGDYTVIRQLREDGVERGVALPLGGQLPIFDIRRDSIITEQVIQNQKALTLTLTQLMRNVNLAGNREVGYVGVEPPYHWEATHAGDPAAEPDGAGGYRRKVLDPVPVGPGKRNFYKTEVTTDEQGNERPLVNPLINVLEPVAVDTFLATANMQRAAALNQMQQAHMLMADQATASGKSREQARAEFKTSLEITKLALDTAGRWLIETALAWAATFQGRAAAYTDLRAEFGAIVDTGPLSADEQRLLMERVEKGTLSLESFLALVGQDDPDAERARILKERGDLAMLDPLTRENVTRVQEARARDNGTDGAIVARLMGGGTA